MVVCAKILLIRIRACGIGVDKCTDVGQVNDLFSTRPWIHFGDLDFEVLPGSEWVIVGIGATPDAMRRSIKVPDGLDLHLVAVGDATSIEMIFELSEVAL